MSEPAGQRGELIAALLGPGGPEVTCEECFDELDRYVEVAQNGGDADQAVPGMRAHLAGCPACREDYESLRDLVRADPTPEAPSTPAP
jgi:hypothetical protein